MAGFDYDFNALFADSDGGPVEYQGKTIYLADKFPMQYRESIRVTIEETNSQYLQGVGFRDGVEIFGGREARAVVFEHFSVEPALRDRVRSRLPFSFDVTCRNRQGFLWIYNVADVDGVQQWWFQGCAMLVEDLPNGRRYRCNDWQLNDDFDDIIFRVERAGG